MTVKILIVSVVILLGVWAIIEVALKAIRVEKVME
jgi:hypothetical protein